MTGAFEVLNDMVNDGVVENYAVAGAFGAMFYTEPVETFDMDVIALGESPGTLVSLESIYAWLVERGHRRIEKEHVWVAGFPVQFLPAGTALAEEAVVQAVTMDVEGVSVRVVSPEHLVALALELGGAKYVALAAFLLEGAEVDRPRLRQTMTGLDVPNRGVEI